MTHSLAYARVSTAEQDPALQLDALAAAGCYRVFTDVASGAKSDRPQLNAVLDQLRPGDTLVVWRLYRLGRSVPDLVSTVLGLREREVGFLSLTAGIDTTSAAGRFMLVVLAGLAEMERELMRERTAAGSAAARARGRHGGRPQLMSPAQLRLARAMRQNDPPDSYDVIARELSLSKTTVCRHLMTAEAPAAAVTQPPAGSGSMHAGRWCPVTRRTALWLAWDVLVSVLRWALILTAALVEVTFVLLGVVLTVALAVVTLGVVANTAGSARGRSRGTLGAVMLVDALFGATRRRGQPRSSAPRGRSLRG